MNINEIESKLKNVEPKPIDEDPRFSVLVPLIEIDEEINLLYEVRSKKIKQPGDISFPGGKIEECESPVYAAVRETEEELGIKKENIEIISELDYATSKNGSFVYSFLAYVKNVNVSEIEYSRDEVSELFCVPISFFLENEPKKHYMNYYPQADNDFPYNLVNDGENYDWGNIRHPVYFYKYGDYVIWGLTAKITYSFINKIKKHVL
ncbi:MAG: CoA pyrophosphatase [Sedimentibacter sp.]|uniref:NUDIX hydrolase n=1 Tax=Sedimentibacter sp. TaxID=1960295 RepID=UPI0029824B2E|nr:CoA pyrophosphatase [Sedimentibacter sp.]MDW5299217.1 CoA pyrophosphatase [Sedimentibacter sp.]